MGCLAGIGTMRFVVTSPGGFNLFILRLTVSPDKTARDAAAHLLSLSHLIQISRAELGELAKHNSLPDAPHAVKVEGQIVVGAERRSQHLAAVVKVPDVSARIAPADRALALLVERALVAGELCVPNVHLPARGEDLAVARVPRWHHAIEHVHAARHAFDQILRRPHAHQIAWLVSGHLRRDEFGDVVHPPLLFPDTEPADRVAFETYLDQLIQTLPSQIFIDAALIDSEERGISSG